MTNDPCWRTTLSEYSETEIRYRGFDVTELLGETDFTSVIALLATGELPSEAERRVLDALLISVADHGISPSQAISRNVAASGSPIQASVAAGVLSIADTHAGAGELLARRIAAASADEESTEALANDLVAGFLADFGRVPGFGHPHHPSGDPRAPALLDLADEEGVSGDHVALLRAVGDELAAEKGTTIPMNVDGAMASLLLDMGYPPVFARALVILSRSVGLVAHAMEVADQELSFPRSVADVAYEGPEPRSFDQ